MWDSDKPFKLSIIFASNWMRKTHREVQSSQIWSSEGERSTNRGHLGARGDPIVKLISAFDEVYKYKEWMVPLDGPDKKIGDSMLIGQTFIISGPAQSGKASLVYWALQKDDRIAVVTVDCSLYRTEMQFIQKLTKEIGEKIGAANLDRRVVASENIKFSDLNSPIQQHGTPIVILIRNAERLVEVRKQILLYNLLEWMLTDINKMIGLVFTTRLMFFVDRFEKRVRSRLAAKHISVTRPSPENLRLLILRRLECLLEQEEEAGGEVAARFYGKLHHCIKDNKAFVEIIRENQEYAQKDIVYYLNAMKITFATFNNVEEVFAMNDGTLKLSINQRFKESFNYIFPFIPKNLLKTCTYPEYVVMAIIYYMAKHQRTPFRFKTVYEIYLQFRQKLVTQDSSGSSFSYSKTMLERAVLKLQELHLIELDSKDESLWNCDIRCSLYPDDLKKTMLELNENDKLPLFIQEILN